MDWHMLKDVLAQVSMVSKDALHVGGGVALQLLLAMATRRRVADPLPWFLVLALQLGNEWYDLNYEFWPTRAVQWGESAKDVALTMLLPTVLLVLARVRPQLFGRATDGRIDTA